MSGHTPGPWAVEGSGVSAHHAANDKRCQYWICDQVNGDRRPDATTGRPSDNARLIAAAPDLLAALEMVRDADNDCRDDGLPCIPALARGAIDGAIAKATGDQT